jgi:hypothetical protein
MKIGKLFQIKKSRKFPIERDKAGLSLRTRCFDLFDQGKRPAEVAAELKAKPATVYRYYTSWKKLGPNFEKRYAFVKSLFRKDAPDRGKNIELFSRMCGIPKEQFEALLSIPHGLRRFVAGNIYLPIAADTDRKRYIALELAVLISDHLINNKGKFEDIYHALRRWMRENAALREQEEIDIEEENKIMAMIHQVLKADMEKERRERVKPDTLSHEEREALMRYGIESEIKSLEAEYWIRIGKLRAEGLTPEQARERIYQDVVQGGDLKRAKAMRQFQDKVHPLESKGLEEPPASPPEL